MVTHVIRSCTRLHPVHMLLQRLNKPWPPAHPTQHAARGKKESRARPMPELHPLPCVQGLGMVLVRVALGDPPRVSALGELFGLLMSAQVVLLGLGWDPVKTGRKLRAIWR